MLQDNIVLYFMTKSNIQSYVKDTEILVIKKCNSEVCYNSFLQRVSRYLYTGSVNFSVLVNYVQALLGCSLRPTFQHISPCSCGEE